jgi:hypothetical protein
VDVIPRRLWNDFKEPSMPDFDVRDFLHSFLKPSGSHILFSGDRSGLDSADVLKLTTENRLQLIIWNNIQRIKCIYPVTNSFTHKTCRHLQWSGWKRLNNTLVVLSYCEVAYCCVLLLW